MKLFYKGWGCTLISTLKKDFRDIISIHIPIILAGPLPLIIGIYPVAFAVAFINAYVPLTICRLLQVSGIQE